MYYRIQLYFLHIVCKLLFRLHVFFFQAEDGIRDLVRSRGLGDVYKRQVPDGRQRAHDVGGAAGYRIPLRARVIAPAEQGIDIEAVSYTHLTLPTIYSV